MIDAVVCVNKSYGSVILDWDFDDVKADQLEFIFPS